MNESKQNVYIKPEFFCPIVNSFSWYNVDNFIEFKNTDWNFIFCNMTKFLKSSFSKYDFKWSGRRERFLEFYQEIFNSKYQLFSKTTNDTIIELCHH